MDLPPDDPRRPVEFRRFSAIYGRFDAKRKPDKPLSYHECLVNEAAAQLCLCRPELLTRRDELFPLARRLVREANFRAPYERGGSAEAESVGGGVEEGGGGMGRRRGVSESESRASEEGPLSSGGAGTPRQSGRWVGVGWVLWSRASLTHKHKFRSSPTPSAVQEEGEAPPATSEETGHRATKRRRTEK